MAQRLGVDPTTLNERMNEIEIKLVQRIDRPQVIEHIRHFCSLAKGRLQNLTPEQKQLFLRFLIDEIILDSTKRKAKIIGEIPPKEEDLQKMANPSEQIGVLSMFSRSRVQYSISPLKFELEVKI